MLDVVRFGTGTYICTSLTNLDPTNTSVWQLLAADGPTGLPGAGVTNFSTQTRIFNFTGPLSPTVGFAKYVPPQTITVSSVYAVIGVQSSAPVVAVIKKNGASVATVTLAANSNRTLPQSVSIVVTTNDYLTVDVVSAVDGQNLNLTLVYS